MDKIIERKISDDRSVSLGCDPEFFFTANGKIVGSEKIIPPDGLRGLMYSSMIVQDGVQAELNPNPSECRESLAAFISDSMRSLYSTCKKLDVEINFSPTVKMSDEELDQLSEKSKTFGCAPSKNLKGESKITVNPKEYNYRSAGGHIHLGTNQLRVLVEPKLCRAIGCNILHQKTQKREIDPERLVNMLDIIMGNTCVLVDRDPGNVERRKVYGKAGEFRTPEHGVEYRTLSNFWLKNYTLMSMVFAFARQAVDIVAYSSPEHDYYQMVMDAVDKRQVDRAINENKYLLAYQNYKQILPVMRKICNPDHCVAFSEKYEKNFRFFITKKMDYWFPQDPLEHWMKLNVDGNGWESFLTKIVPKKMTFKNRVKDLIGV